MQGINGVNPCDNKVPVKRNDTLWGIVNDSGIAKRLGISLSAAVELVGRYNGLEVQEGKPTIIKIGQNIKIPDLECMVGGAANLAVIQRISNIKISNIKN
ncbi:MAG: LysM peptidoglycan-binding domain-containing protein [Candidatus Margulisbacteria bacterium]|nr:LysM peptidoglycan-binding domain-containing protein [Candidatus Margulisiibacteriota bacterium]